MPRITPREWLNAALLAVMVVVITSIPYWIAWHNAGADWAFGGALIGVEDMNSYLGKMRIGARGEFDFTIFYTAEAHDPAPLVFLPYSIPGWIVGRFVDPFSPQLTPALIGMFHLVRALADVVLVFVIYAFAARFIAEPRDRLAATLLAVFAGGLGFLVLPLMGVGWLGSPPPDIFIPEGFGFLVAYHLPHVVIARAALITGLILLTPPPSPPRIRGGESAPFEGTATSDNVSSKSGNLINSGRNSAAGNAGKRDGISSPSPNVVFGKRKLTGKGLGGGVILPFLAGICWLIVGLCVPFYLAVVYAILGAWGLASWIIERRFPAALFWRAAVAAGITLPLFAYLMIRFSDPVFAAWSAQNLLASPHPLHYVLAYLPLALPAYLGARKLWRSAPLLIGWVLIMPILVYLPINVQRRLSEGVIVALAVLAAVGLRRMPRLAHAAVLIVLLGTSAFLLVGGMLTARTPNLPVFRPADEVAAFNWLNANAESESIILASVESGNALPAWTHLRVYMGHGPETIAWQSKTAALTAFYRGELTDTQAAALLENPCASVFPCAGAVEYVLWGERERALAGTDDPPAYVAEWSVVYDADGYRIYANPN